MCGKGRGKRALRAFASGGLSEGMGIRPAYDYLTRGPTDENEASNLRAAIAREQWEDYKQRFQPLENTLLGYANNRQGFVSGAKQESLNRVNSVYGLAQPQIERRLGSYGLQITPEIQNRIAKRLNYEKGLADVQAANTSTRLAQDQLTAIQGGGLLSSNKVATIK